MKKSIKKSLKTSNGITLIALVITIIVLLILAGISISMVSGDNSILQKATTAKESTDSSQIQERINLAYHSSLVDGHGKVTEPSLESELKKEFNKNTLNEGWLDKTSAEGKWKITIDGVSLEVPAGKQDNQDNDKVTIKVGARNLKEVSDLTTLYGETTDFTSIEGVEWQLFYDDTNYIYMIASDYVSGEFLPSELISDGEYTSYCRKFANYSNSTYTGTIIESTPWSNGAESNTITENVQTNTYLKWVNSSLATTKNNLNMKAVAYMMDTNKWSDFAGNTRDAYAIGGPTLEMFVQSYNAIPSHTSKLGTYETINTTNADVNGYKVKIGTSSWGDYISGLDSSSDNMWVKKSTNKAYGMWLAAPCCDKMHYILRVNFVGGLVSSDAYATDNGFRPLVAIPKSSLK